MSIGLFLAVFAGSAYALNSRDGSCCFHLAAHGGPGGSVGQLSDGQARIGQKLAAAEFCIAGGALNDDSGRGCIVTPPTTQLQCDADAAPTSSFSIGCNGTLELGNQSEFVACPTEDNGGYNIYITAPAGQQKCVSVTLEADECKANCRAPASTPTSAPAAAATPSSCSMSLSGTYEFPHLIVPISLSSPNKALGTSYNGTMTPDISSIFNFDIPASDKGKMCSLVFLFPDQHLLNTSAYEYTAPASPSYGIEFSGLVFPATESTTYANAPAVKSKYGTINVEPGVAYDVANFPCPAGEKIGVEAKSVGGTAFNYFQDFNEPAIGLYVTVC